MTKERRTPPVWRRIALPVSIIVNLFFVAVVGEHLWLIHHYETSANSPLMLALARAEAALSAQDAAAFSAVIKRDAPRYAPAAGQLSQTRLDLDRQITAEHFDPVATKQALKAWQVAWNRFVDDFGDTMIDALGQVSADGRRRMVAVHKAHAALGGP